MQLRWRNRGWCAVLVVVQVLLVVCTTSGNSVTAAAARHQENVATTEEETETDAGPPPSPPTLPTAFVTGGGGFKTMTAGMGIIRAWSDTELLRAHTTTHFACASGGCWFQIPFLYSQDYYDAAVGKSSRGGDGTVADFVTSWGEKYQTAATKAIATEQYNDIYQYTLETVSNYCPLDLVHIITAGMRKLLNEADFPADNWLNYVDVMLSSYLHVPNATTQLFSSPRAGWNKFVFVAGGTFLLLRCLGWHRLDWSFPNIFYICVLSLLLLSCTPLSHPRTRYVPIRSLLRNYQTDRNPHGCDVITDLVYRQCRFHWIVAIHGGDQSNLSRAGREGSSRPSQHRITTAIVK